MCQIIPGKPVTPPTLPFHTKELLIHVPLRKAAPPPALPQGAHSPRPCHCNICLCRPCGGLAVLCPSLALCFRRLHDIGKSGVWILVSLIPLVGWIWMLILLCKDSDPGANQYGENPKGM